VGSERPRGLSPVQGLQDRRQRVERGEGDRVHHQLDVRDPLGANTRRTAAISSGVPATDGIGGWPAPPYPALPAREPDLDRERARHSGRIAAGVAARRIDAVADAGTPAGQLPNASNQAFHASTCGIVIASIRARTSRS